MVKYIEPKELAEILRRSDSKKVLVVDVRDSDYEMAKIKGSLNVPYTNLNKLLPKLIKTSESFSRIVFHCHFSARRGPSAAQIFEDSVGRTDIEVLVLRGGFEKWFRLYSKQEDLYEVIL